MPISKRSIQLEVIRYLEPDFVESVNSRKSTFAYLFLHREWAISWKSVKEIVIVASTIEVEFATCFEVTIHTLWLQNYVLGLGVINTIIKLLKIYYDDSIVIFFL